MDVNRIAVWECIGCGRIDHPRPCVGICRDVKAEYVPASEHDAALAVLERRCGVLHAALARIAAIEPREGRWQANFRALQDVAREALEA